MTVPTPSLFGFGIDAHVPMHFLRAGGGIGTLEIVEAEDPGPPADGELLGDWELGGGALPARATLHRVHGGFEYRTSDAGRFGIAIDQGRIEVPVGPPTLLREQRVHGLPLILHFLARGDHSLHAAAVEIDGGAVVLAAPSKHGKTTLAFAFHEAGYRLLSEDIVCWRPGSMEVLPGPALARLRPDMHSGTAPAGTSVLAEDADRVWLGIDPARRGSSAPVPLRAVIFLRLGEAAVIEPVPRHAVLQDLWALGFRIPDRSSRADQFRHLAALAGSVPVFNFARPLRRERLRNQVALIANVVGSRGTMV